MKGTLEFNLPEDQDDFDTATNGWKYRSVIDDIDGFLRNKLKYDNLTQEQYDAYDKVRTELWNFINEHNIDIH
jgi:hypothetical protein